MISLDPQRTWVGSFPFNKAKRSIVIEDDDLHRKPYLAWRDEVSHCHAEAAMPDIEMTWRSGCVACAPVACSIALAIRD